MPRCHAIIQKRDTMRECQRSQTTNSGYCWQHVKIEDKIGDCPICLEKLSTPFSVIGQPIIRLRNCSHLFHEKCMGIWTASKDNCPLCRAAVNFTDIIKLNSNRARGVNAMVSMLPPLLRRAIWGNIEEFVQHFNSSQEIDFIPVPI